MHIVALAWIFVTLLVALAQATSPQGSVLGGLFTFLLWGVAPLSIVLYVMGSPMRRRARREQERASADAATPAAPPQAPPTQD